MRRGGLGAFALALTLWLALFAPAAPASAQQLGTVPVMKLAQADLVAPNQAWAYYGTGTTHTLGISQASDPGPEIRAVARSLGSGRYGAAIYTQNVFDYIRNNIEVEFRFGLAKGARGALIDQSGTPFDQAELMVKLLQQAGVPNVSFRIGTITLSEQQFGQWTGLVTNPGAGTLHVDAAAACHLLADGGIPAIVNNQTTCASVSGELTSLTVAHIWVAANGNLYDPAYKPHTLKASQDLASLMDCGSAGASTCGAGVLGQMLSTASTAPVAGFPAVQNASESGATGAVQALAVDLQHKIEASNPGAGLDDIIGGKRIDTSYAPKVASTLPYASLEQMSWDAGVGIPDKYRSTLALHTDTHNLLFYSDEISTRRLQLANGGVYVDNAQIEGCPANPCLTVAPSSFTITAAHPYAYQGGAFATNSIWAPSGLWITIIQSWGDASPPTQKYFADLVSSDTSLAPAFGCGYVPAQSCSTEDQVALAASFFVQRSMFNRLLGQVSGAVVGSHHTIGAISATTLSAGPVANPNYSTSTVSTISVDPAVYSSGAVTAGFEASSVAQATIEGVDMQQARHTPVAMSSITAFVQENRQHTAFVQVPGSSTQAFAQSLPTSPIAFSAIAPLTFADKANFSWIFAADPAVVWAYIPDFADLSVNPNHLFFTTFFNLAVGSGANSYLMGGSLKGAATPAPVADDPLADVIKTAHAAEAGRAIKELSVEEASGSLNIHPPPDLVTGSGEFPFSLPFQRFYSSGAGAMEVLGVSGIGSSAWHYTGAGEDTFTHLGGGWSHNYEITASINSNPQKSFGRDGALNASAAIATAFVLNDLFKTPDLQHRLAAMFAAYWLGGQIDDNAVVVSKPPSQEAFLKLPDGRFNAPPGSASNLSQQGVSGAFYFAMIYGDPNPTMSTDYGQITFSYTDRDGSVINFLPASFHPNLQGQVLQGFGGDPTFRADKWIFPNGVKITFTYQFESLNWLGRALIGPTYQRYNLIGVSNSLGRSLSFTTVETGPKYQPDLDNGGRPSGTPMQSFNVGLKITAVTDENNRTVQYTLANCPPNPAFGGGDFGTVALACNTFLVTDPMGFQSKYDYTADGFSPDPSVVVRPNYKIRRVYSADDQTNPLIFVAYDDLLRVATETDALQRVTTHMAGGLAEEIWKRAELVDARGNSWVSIFDENNSLLAATDPTNATTQHVYDAMRREVKTINPEGDAVTRSYDVRSNVLTTTRFPKPGSPLQPTTTTVAYPEVQGLITCVHPANCNKPSVITDARNNPSHFTFDPTTGELTQILGAADNHSLSPQTDLAYTATAMGNDTVQLLTSVTKKISAGVSTTTTYAYNAGNKFVLSSATVDAGSGQLNLTTGFQFDAIGNVTQVDGPRDDVADITNYVWDADRRLSFEVLADPDGAGPQARVTNHWTYDNDGLFVTVEKGSSTSATAAGYAAVLSTEYVHDAVGNRIREIVHDLSNGGTPLSVSQFFYDPTDNLRCTAVRMDSTTFANLATADPCVVVSSGTNLDGPDRITVNTYDGRGKLVQVDRGVTATVGGQPVGLEREIYGYSLNGQKTQITDGNSNLTTLVYDGFDRLQNLVYPALARGAGASDTADHEDYGYDPNDNKTSFRRRNGLSITYDFDALNRISAKHLQNDSAHDVYYDYDLLGRQTSALFGGPTGQGTVLTYDHAGRLTLDQTYGRAVSASFDKGGDRIAVTLGDGFSIAYDYDAAGRMTGVREPGQTACPTALVCLAYDNVGRRSRIDRGNGGYATYGYDGGGRLNALTQAGVGAASSTSAGPSVQTVNFNAAAQAKLLVQQADAYVWSGLAPISPSHTFNGLNQDSAYATISGYDGNGNLTADGQRTMTYDLENRLTHVGPAAGQSGTTLDIAYDPLGRIYTTTATTGGASTITGFLYDGDKLVAEYGAGGTPLRHYVHGPGVDEPLVWYEGAVQTSPKAWLHADRQGSIIGVSDTAGNVAAYNYGPYGEPKSWSGSRFAYTGQIALPEAQLYHYKARVYDPMMGRFLQADPVGYSAGLDLYEYVGDDPTNATDPSGNCIEDACILEGAFIVASCAANPTCRGVVGGISGFLLGGGVSAAKQAHDNHGHVNWREAGKEGVKDGIVGAVGGATLNPHATAAAAGLVAAVDKGHEAASRHEGPKKVLAKAGIAGAEAATTSYLGGKVAKTITKVEFPTGEVASDVAGAAIAPIVASASGALQNAPSQAGALGEQVKDTVSRNVYAIDHPCGSTVCQQ